MKNLKKIPVFKDENEEAEFWAKHDSTEFIDYKKAKRTLFPNLKPSLRTIPIRLPESLLEHLKVLANKGDIPYQTLMKMDLAEKVEEQMHSGKR